jgi:serine protease Do
MSGIVQVNRKVALVALAVALVGGIAFGLGVKSWSGRSVLGAEKVPVTVAKDIAPVNLGNFSNGFSSVIKPALPAVVNIKSSKLVKASEQEGSMAPFMQDPMFRQFFGQNPHGMQPPQDQHEHSLGSGVIVNGEGYILTNNHVVDGATDVRVYLNDKREFPAKIIGTDSRTDLAVLKIDAHGLPAITLGDSSRMQVGDVVFAIGNPFDVGETATMGIVSAMGRGGLAMERGGIEDFIQTDAAINPGNSGGALLDVHGNLVGINTAILTNGGGGNQGVGFAIPVDLAHSVMDQIVTHGHVVRGYLGIVIGELSPELAGQFGLKQGGGALIEDVTAGGPADKAGLKRGDVIQEIDGKTIDAVNTLQVHVASRAPGSQVTLRIFRDGKPTDVKATLGEMPEKLDKADAGEKGSAVLEGLEVQTLTPELAGELNVPPSTKGVVVTAVDGSSAAAAAGLDRGDVIQEVNHKSVSNVPEYREAMQSVGKQAALLLVNRGGTTHYVIVEAQQ